MFNEIKKEVISNIEGLARRTRRFTIRLMAFTIAFWLVIGTIAVGVVVPAFIAKSLFKTRLSSDAEASVTSAKKLMQATQSKDRYSLRTSRFEGPLTFRKRLRETTDTVNEFRRLVNGLASFESH